MKTEIAASAGSRLPDHMKVPFVVHAVIASASAQSSAKPSPTLAP